MMILTNVRYLPLMIHQTEMLFQARNPLIVGDRPDDLARAFTLFYIVFSGSPPQPFVAMHGLCIKYSDN